MRLSEEKIQAAIGHAEQEVRVTAVDYFADAFSPDPSIMPLVIQAVERYGLAESFRLLRSAMDLVQSPDTVDWLIGRLQEDHDPDNIEQENVHFVLARILCNAAPKLLAERSEQILALPAFPAVLRGPLLEELKLGSRDWPTLWRAFCELGRQMIPASEMVTADVHRHRRYSRLLTGYPEEAAEMALEHLRQPYPLYDEGLRRLQPQMVEIAGLLRLEEAVPWILGRLEDAAAQENDDDDENMVDLREEITRALIRIGGERVVEAVSGLWDQADVYDRDVIGEVLGHIPTDSALQHLLGALPDEKDFLVRMLIGASALNHFSAEAIEPVRQRVLGEAESLDGEELGLRYQLVAAATMMGVKFPEYDAWHREALACNYGRQEDYSLSRAEEDFAGRERTFEELEILEQTTIHYQLKVSLNGVSPPVWRRLRVPNCTLADLHRIIQAAMGWDPVDQDAQGDQYAFGIAGRQFTAPWRQHEIDRGADAAGVWLGELIVMPKRRFTYHYDFEADWRHRIVVEKVTWGRAERGGRLDPVCLKGMRACPPAGVGGAEDYGEYLAILADPHHRQHKKCLALHGPFDPEAFELEAVNAALAMMSD